MGSFLKVLPFFIQMLMEAFKPGEGENVSRANKIMTLIITVLLSYSTFVSYAYVVQFHKLVTVQSHDQYMSQSYQEMKQDRDKLKDDNGRLYDKLFICLGQKPPYESGYSTVKEDNSTKDLTPKKPETPVSPASTPEQRKEASARPVGSQNANSFRQEIIKTLSSPKE
jgi:hypothetical protein